METHLSREYLPHTDAIAETLAYVILIGEHCFSLKESLKNKQVFCFAHAKDFLESVNYLYITSGVHSVILCDLSLEDDEISTLFHRARSQPSFNAIPLIGVAQPHMLERQAAAHRLGFDDICYIKEDVVELTEQINFLIKLKSQKQDHLPQFELSIPKISFRKRAFDITFAVIALLLLSPLMMVISLLIKLESKGSVLFHSQRIGMGYHRFSFYKFRTMRTGAEHELSNLLAYNQYGIDATHLTFVKIAKDPRVTRVGWFLRKTSLDEMPQLFNVLKGDMSLVGNRPLPLYEAEKMTADETVKRFFAPAGITGLWQVSKRGKKQMSDQERRAMDVTYAENRNAWYDLGIIFKTLPAMIQEEEC